MRRKRDRNIEVGSWIVTSLLLLLFVPKDKYRQAQVAFLFKQFITWLFGLIVVEKRLISYPDRLFFRKSNKSSFTFEYFVYPGLCALFNIHFPENKKWYIKCLYYFIHTSIITGFEVYAVKFTNLIRYQKWTWYWSFITIWITYYLARIYQDWFFPKDDIYQKEEGN